MPRCPVCKMHVSDTSNAKRHCDTKGKAYNHVRTATRKAPRRA